MNSNKFIYFIKCNTRGFAPIKVLYEIPYTKLFSYDFSSIKTFSRSMSSNLIVFEIVTAAILIRTFFIFSMAKRFLRFLPMFYIMIANNSNYEL